MAGGVEIRVLRMEVTAAKRDRKAAGDTQAEDQGTVRGEQRGIRLPAPARRAGPRRRAGRRGARPPAHARAGADSVPAGAVAGGAAPAGPGRVDTPPRQTRFFRGKTPGAKGLSADMR